MTQMTYENVKINNPGFVHPDLDSLWMSTSDLFNSIKNGFNDRLYQGGFDGRNNRYKEIVWNGHFMFKELELRLVDGMLFAGAEFDDLYIGKVQNWSAIQKIKAPESLLNAAQG
jgi:hypothetical protein